MNASFAELVESVRRRSPDEKDELIHLLQRDLAEIRRDELAANASDARRQYAAGNLDFTSSVADLKMRLGAE